MATLNEKLRSELMKKMGGKYNGLPICHSERVAHVLHVWEDDPMAKFTGVRSRYQDLPQYWRSARHESNG